MYLGTEDMTLEPDVPQDMSPPPAVDATPEMDVSEEVDEGPALPPGWWDRRWTRRRMIVVGGEYAVDGPITLPLELDHTLFTFESSNGRDLRFVLEGDSAPLPVELEHWDPQGRSTFWVRMPRVEPGQRLWVYSVADGVDPSSAEGVWGEEVRAVYHFSEVTDRRVLDSGPGAQHLRLSQTTTLEAGDPSGKTGPSLYFSGAEENRLTAEDSPIDMGPAESLTIEINVVVEDHDGFILGDEVNCFGERVELHERANMNGSLLIRHARSMGDCSDYPAVNGYDPHRALLQEANHIVVVFDWEAQEYISWSNGRVLQTRRLPGKMPGEFSVSEMTVGSRDFSKPPLQGWLDEVIIHEGALDPDVIRLRHLATHDNASLFRLGSEERLP